MKKLKKKKKMMAVELLVVTLMQFSKSKLLKQKICKSIELYSCVILGESMNGLGIGVING